MKTLTTEQAAILHHTIHRAAGGRYCGGGPEMDALVGAGLMELLGKPSWAIDSYYTITKAGRDALAEWQAAQPKPPAPKKLTRSQKRYREFLHADSGHTFREWLGIRAS